MFPASFFGSDFSKLFVDRGVPYSELWLFVDRGVPYSDLWEVYINIAEGVDSLIGTS